MKHTHAICIELIFVTYFISPYQRIFQARVNPKKNLFETNRNEKQKGKELKIPVSVTERTKWKMLVFDICN